MVRARVREVFAPVVGFVACARSVSVPGRSWKADFDVGHVAATPVSDGELNEVVLVLAREAPRKVEPMV